MLLYFHSMHLFIEFALFLLGAVTASFAGVVAARLHTGQSWLGGRSRCDACGAPLSAFSLVPVLSYAAGRGRAQCCGARISPMAPLSELALGVLFALSYLSLGLSWALLFTLLSWTALLALVLYDFAHQILPPPLLAVLLGVSCIAGFLAFPDSFPDALVIAALLAGLLALIHFLSRGRAMGLADAPLTFALSVLAGPHALPGFVFSFWIGAVIGIFILFGRPRGSRMGIEVPFAPFLAAGFILAYFTQWNPFAFAALLLP